MTANVASTVWNLLVLAFFAVCVIGVAIGAYAAVSLKKAEGAQTAQVAPAEESQTVS